MAGSHKKTDGEAFPPAARIWTTIEQAVQKYESKIAVGVLLVLLVSVWLYSGIIFHILLAMVCYEIGKHARKVARILSEKYAMDATLLDFLARVVELLAPMMMIYCVLRSLHVVSDEVNPQILGTCSITLGLASQSVLSNFAAGLVLIIFRPFRLKDCIVVQGKMVIVTRIGIFFTHADAWVDGCENCIPNASILSASLGNVSTNELMVIRLRVHLRQGRKSCRAIRTVLEKAAASIDSGADEILEKNDAKQPERRKTVVNGPLCFGPEGMDWELEVHAPTSVFSSIRDFGNTTVHDVLMEHEVEFFEHQKL